MGEGYETLVTADYSQIEMRIMAHLSGDEALIDAFKAGEDLHRFVGSRVFGVPPEGVTPEMRSHVKAMSYGLAYGLSSFGLARQLGVAVGEAQALMDDYFARFGVGARVSQRRREASDDRRLYRDHLRAEAGTCLTCHRRTGSGVTWPSGWRSTPRSKEAQPTSSSAPCSPLMHRLAAEGLQSRQILQVHDELVVEAAPGEADAVETILREEMARRRRRSRSA